MSDLVDRLVELASWCEQHSDECPVTAHDDLIVAAFRLDEAYEERNDEIPVAGGRGMSETWCKKCKAQTDWIQWHDDKYEREVYCCEWCGRKEYIYDDDEGTPAVRIEVPDLVTQLRCGDRVADIRTRRELEEAADEIERYEETLQEWQRVGDAIMAAIGQTGPLSDSEVIGEINRLRSELQVLQDWLKDNSWTIDDEDI